MPRSRTILSDRFSYHVYNRSNNREWFYLPMEEMWEIFTKMLSIAMQRYGAEIHTFVLMSNHYHLIVSTPLANLDQFMRYFQTEAAKEVQRRTGRINHIFGNRYKWSLLSNATAFAYCYKYVLRNPIRVQLSKEVQTYPYGSLFLLQNKSRTSLPHTERRGSLWRFIPKPFGERLEWLNSPTPKELEGRIKLALRRFEFKFSQGNDARKQLKELEQGYGIPLEPSAPPATFSAEKSIGTFWD